MARVQQLPRSHRRSANPDVLRVLGHPSSEAPERGDGKGSLDRLIEEAEERIVRLGPSAALSATATGAVIIDIRSQDSRERHGVIPGSLHIPRTVLEWRIAIDSPWRNPHLGGLDQQLILVCDHGYSSILAAGNLVQLGFYRAGDVIGGFEAWTENCLPTAPCRRPVFYPGVLPGAGPPE